MLTCREITELIDDFIDGRLSLWVRVKFQVHVGMCEHCREYLRQLKLTRDSLGKLPEPEMSPAVRDELMARFRDWKQNPSSRDPGPDGGEKS